MITDLFTEQELTTGLLCKAFSRHFWDGIIEQTKYNGEVLWTERFACTLCDTRRITPLEVGTGTQEGGRQYKYTDAYDRNRTSDDARRIVTGRIAQASGLKVKV